MSSTEHISVMLSESMKLLDAEKGGVFVDCTLGGGGHTRAILGANRDNFVYAFDRDGVSTERVYPKERVKVIKDSFSRVANHISPNSIDGLLADLGMSTDQLLGRRGFSFHDENLDMRMDIEQLLTGSSVVNDYSSQQLTDVLGRGGVKNPRQVASKIVSSRPIISAKELIQKIGQLSKDPAVLLQAIRIEVNQEYSEIETLLNLLPSLCKHGARVVVISFHSLEDKIVARCFRDWHSGCTCPKNRVCSCNQRRLGQHVTPKAVVPTAGELKLNPAARSARMRSFVFL